MVYAIYKFELLVAKDESRLQTTVEESYYDETYTFSSSQGFNMAFGISSYQNSDLYYNDPRFHEYGRLQLLLHTRDSEKGIIKTEVIPIHKCNLIEVKSGRKGVFGNYFHETRTIGTEDIDKIVPQLECFDRDLSLFGG